MGGSVSLVGRIAALLRGDGSNVRARARLCRGGRGGHGRTRAIYSPEPLNRAFGPDGFLRHFDLRPELARITAPTLILAGRHDWICPVAFSEEIHRLVPGSDLRVFERSSHSIRSDEPEALADAILGFVRISVRGQYRASLSWSGRAGAGHRRIVPVVLWPCCSSTSSTIPPQPCTRSAPTTWSML